MFRDIQSIIPELFILDRCVRFEKNFIFGHYNIDSILGIWLFSGYAPQMEYYL